MFHSLFSKALFRVVGIGTDDFKFGMTKVFFRPGKVSYNQILYFLIVFVVKFDIYNLSA